MTKTTPALESWMAVIAEDGWAGATLARVARHAGLPLAAVAEAAPDAWTAIDRAAARADMAALAATPPESDGPMRDRLFDLVMARFDALADSREAHRRLLREARTRPALALALAALTGRAAARLVGAAGLPTTGPGGILRINALAAILADTGRVWLDDPDADLSTTMRRLDQRLGLAERWAQKLGRGSMGPMSDSLAEPAPTV